MTTKYLPQSIIFRDNCLEGEAARLRSPAPGPACSMWCPQRTSQVRPSTGTRGWDSKCGVGESDQHYHIKNHRHYWQKIEWRSLLPAWMWPNFIPLRNPWETLETDKRRIWTHFETYKQNIFGTDRYITSVQSGRSQQTWMQLNTHHLMHENVILCHT